MNLKILKHPNSVLRKKGQDLKFPLNEPTRKLIKDMHQTLVKAQGIGLAAPQVGYSLNLVVINLEHLGVPAFTLINPVITKFSKNQTDLEEGCLSIPGIYGIVERPEKIEFCAYTEAGQKISAKADAMLAKVIQHEVDHINGVLIIDKIKKYTDGVGNAAPKAHEQGKSK